MYSVFNPVNFCFCWLSVCTVLYLWTVFKDTGGSRTIRILKVWCDMFYYWRDWSCSFYFAHQIKYLSMTWSLRKGKKW